MNIGTLAARLSRIRAENRAARVVDGLGARNIPYARAHGASGLAAVFAGGDAPESQAALAGQSLARFDAVNTRQDAQIAKLKADVGALGATVRRVESLAGTGPASGGGGFRRQTLGARLAQKGFGIKRTGIELGPLEIGRGGIGVNASFLRGAGGKLFKASIAMHVVGGGLDAFASGKDMLNDLDRKGATSGEKSRALGGGVASPVVRTLASITGVDTLASGLFRAAGFTKEDAAAKVEKFYNDLFTTREELARRANARREAIARADAEIAEGVGKAWEKLNTTLPDSFRLSGKGDLQRYRKEMKDLNRGIMEAKANALRDRVRREAEARSAEGN